ncbi:MAG: hypothetical protein PHV47_00710 [Candidatus Pacebacteria bacterium]|nr:hypothetical protein [Candidatus Paceibacterota bacterium]
MKSYRFSPIENKEQLFEAIKYTHFKCFELCKNIFGKYLPVAGNIGIFCHFENEYQFLTELRKQLTVESDNWNQKYYRLHEPIIIPSQGDMPETVYTYLYIRKPDQHMEVGDVDFVLDVKRYNELKKVLIEGKRIKGMEIFDRSELDLIRLSDPYSDVVSFIGKMDIGENIRNQNRLN